jgi:hypothetical protein
MHLTTFRLLDLVVTLAVSTSTVMLTPEARADEVRTGAGPSTLTLVEAPRLRGIELALSGFEASAFGDAQSSISMDSAFGATAGVGLDVGYRIDNHFYVGIFASGACFGCGIATGQAGAVARFHLRPLAFFDPWVGAGLAYEDSGATTHGAAGYDGVLGHVQGGVDLKPLPQLAVGPFLDLSVGEYTSVDPEAPSDSSNIKPAVHGWFQLGVRCAYDIRF